MEPAYIVLYIMAAILVLFVLVAALILFMYLAEWMGCDIPNWMQKLKK